MTMEDFYKKFANLRIDDRFIAHHFIKDGLAHSLTLADLYKLIDSQNDIRRNAQVEIDEYLRIVTTILK